VTGEAPDELLHRAFWLALIFVVTSTEVVVVGASECLLACRYSLFDTLVIR